MFSDLEDFSMVKSEEILEISVSGDSPDCLEKFRQALISFSVPDDKIIKRPQGFSKCPNRDIEEYFEFVAKVGKPFFKWEIIRPAFLWKLNQIICDMEKYESDDFPENSMSPGEKEEELCNQRDFIMKKAAQFEGTPFTFQRLCELLITPSRHYKRLDKFLRALEKNINVVTTVTEYGERVTGVDEYFEEDDERPRGIEQTFFVKENGSPMETKKDELLTDDTRPINLSAVFKDSSETNLLTPGDPEKIMEMSEAGDSGGKEGILETTDNENQMQTMAASGDNVPINFGIEDMELVRESQGEDFERKEQYNQSSIEEEKKMRE